MHTFPEHRLQAEQFRVLSNESRIAVCKELRKGPMNLTEIADFLRIRIMNASKHIQKLIHVGFVVGKRQGMEVRFSLTKSARSSKRLWESIEKGVQS